MLGKIKRKELLNKPLNPGPPQEVCPLCDRLIPKADLQAHHWIPKSKGGRETAHLHAICHRQVHALFTENELAREFHSPQRLLSDERFAKFIDWVKRKPIDFKQSTRKSNRLKAL
jgi:hypothetical protein